MTFEEFELGIIDLASRRVRLTVANVAMHMRMAPSKVEEMMDKMAREGRLDVELDEERGVIFYVVRGLTPPPQDIVLRPAPPRTPPPSHPAVHAPRGNKSVALGALFGLLAPGIGLLYAAPMKATVVVTIATIIGVKMIAAVPLIGWLLSSVALGIAALASAVLGAMYVRKFNQTGQRTHLDLAATRQASRTLVDPLRQAERVATQI